MNETLKTIQARYSCRSYTDQPVEPEKLEAIAQAATQAPSGMNVQPWKIIIVRDKKLVNEMDAEGIRVMKSMEDQSAYERIMGRGGKLFYNAPAMAIITIDPSASHLAMLDCGIVTQNIALAATSLGLGSVICAMANIPLSGDKGADFKKRLGFADGQVFGMAVLLGYEKAPGTAHAPDLSKISFVG